MKRAVLVPVVVLAVCLVSVTPAAQVQVGPNINMATGIDDQFTGDPFLQRQNEIVVGVSALNPDHMIAFMNDYRTIDMANDEGAGSPQQGILATLKRFFGLPPARHTAPSAAANAEGWMGMAISDNGGKNWSSGLVPGYPEDTSPEGAALRAGGYQAASDPWVSCDPVNCHLVGIAFTRGGGSALFYARFTSTNDSERGHNWKLTIPPTVLRKGNNALPGQFVDKPTIVAAVDGTVAVGSVEFDGQDRNGRFQSKVLVSVSHDSGATWSSFQKINQTYLRNQSPALVIDPNDPRKIFALWRVFGDNTVVLRKSVDGGASWGAGAVPVITGYQPFDQATQKLPLAPQFRTSAYPAVAIDGSGALHLAIAERTDPSTGVSMANGTPRIVLTSSRNGGATWTPRKAIDFGPDTGLQFMPAMTAVAEPRRPGDPSNATRSKIMVLYYDTRASNAILPPDSPGPISGAIRFDVRVAAAEAGESAAAAPLSFEPSTLVSRYEIDRRNGGIIKGAGYEYTSVNRAYPMFWSGSAPFTGDYNLVVPRVSYVKTAAGGWRSALALDEDPSTNEIPAPVVQAVWADARDVILPRTPAATGVPHAPGFLESLPWWNYQKPGTGALPDDACNAGSRNQNPYTAEITTGVVAAAPVTYKNPNMPRSYPVYVNNTTKEDQYWRLTIDPNANASFSAFFLLPPGAGYGEPKKTTDIIVLPFSTVTGTVFVAQEFTAPVRVTLERIDDIDGTLMTGTAASSSVVTLNTDGGTDAGAATSETHAADITDDPYVITYTIDNETGEPYVSPFGQNPFGQNPFGQNPFGQNPFGQNPFGQNPFGQNPFGQNPFGQNTFGENPFGQNITVTEVTYIIRNAGNTSSAYKAFAGLQQQLNPDIYKFQLLVNRLTTAPGLNGCMKTSDFRPVQVSSLANPFGQNPFGQNPFGQNPFGQNPFGQNPFGQNPFGQNPFGQNPFGQNGAPSDNSTFYIAPQPGSSTQTTTAASRMASTSKKSSPSAPAGSEISTVAPRQTDEIWYTLRVYQLRPPAPGEQQFDPALVTVAVVPEAPDVAVDSNGDVIITPPEPVFRAPDLRYTGSLVVPATLPVNGLVDLPSMAAENAGDGAAGPFHQALYMRLTGGGATDPWTLIGIGPEVAAGTGAGSPVTVGGATGLTVPAALTAGSYDVCAVIDPDQTVAESNEENNTACTTTTLFVPQADIAVSVYYYQAVTEGTNGTTVATVTNNGPNDARNVIFMADVPGTAVSATPSGASCTMTPPSHIDCRLGTLPSGAQLTITLVFTPDVFLVSYVTMSATTATQDPNPANNDASQLIQFFGMPRTFLVTSVSDSGPGSLRQAILDANAHPTATGTDTIAFAIGGPAPHTIVPLTPLPEISGPVVLDATTNPDYAGTPVVELNGQQAGTGAPGFALRAGYSTVRGFAINRFNGPGVELLQINSITLPPESSGYNVIEANYIGTDVTGATPMPNGGGGIFIFTPRNSIGSTDPAKRNVISGNAYSGITVSGSNNNLIFGNYIGVDATGTAPLPNAAMGVNLYGPQNTVGGAQASQRNVISGNAVGVAMQSAASNNTIRGNYIGTAADGMVAIPNTTGVWLYAPSNTVSDNLICGNGTGVLMEKDNETLQSNLIGITSGGVPFGNLGNGVQVQAGIGSSITQNTIAFNGGAGVRVFAGTPRIERNSIYANTGLGIDIDPAGPSGTLPAIASAYLDAGLLWINGSMPSFPRTTASFDFYWTTACDPSGYGEGAQWLGSTGGGGGILFPFTFSTSVAPVGVYPGGAITATASVTNLLTGNTSTTEFSQCFTVPTSNASIQGTLTDASAGTVPGATISLVNADGTISRTTMTGAAGQYSFSLLPPGTYTLTAGPGVTGTVTVTAGQTVTLNLHP